MSEAEATGRRATDTADTPDTGGAGAPPSTAPADPATPPAAGGNAHDTVESAVRAQLGKALGGVRGMVEAAVPTIAFTGTYVAAKDIKLAVGAGVGAAVVLLLVRVAQRSSPQFVLNSLVGIAIAAFFALRSGKAEDAFLPGIMLNAGYTAAMIFSIVVRWPVVGFIIGSVTGDPTAWRSDPGILKLCSRLTWLLVLPCALRVAVQYPIYLADGDQSGLLGPAKIVMGWPLQVAALAAMVWLLARGRTPLDRDDRPAA
ncbi:DUF3159 domain-containing protein [Actinomadura macra]|uniref:DUF3159 domain-containing protein n=1 Tax=Actinomadura macra TaxID=46164 RepID=UPI000830C77F|nr:DUF3159 domain-containing protein [Actinomadura macra]